MLPAAHRMRSAADFTDTTRRGAKASRGSVVVYALRVDSLSETVPDPSASADPARVGLIVAKSVGNSVVRHRASRRIRGAIAALLPSLPPGTRVVVRALPGADTDPALDSALATALTAAMDRAR